MAPHRDSEHRDTSPHQLGWFGSPRGDRGNEVVRLGTLKRGEASGAERSGERHFRAALLKKDGKTSGKSGQGKKELQGKSFLSSFRCFLDS